MLRTPQTELLLLELESMRNNQLYENAKSEEVHIQNTVNQKLKKIELCGNTQQIVREGYNLLRNIAETQSIKGVTFTVNPDKSVTVKGTSTDNIAFYLNLVSSTSGTSSKSEPITAGNYALVGCTGGSDATYFLRMALSNRDGVSNISCYNGITNVTLSLETNTYSSYIYIRSGITIDTTFYPMLIKGNYTGATIPAYEAYGKTPSPEIPSEIECVEAYNKFNLQEFVSKNSGYYQLENGNLKVTAVDTRTAGYLPAESLIHLEKGTYTITTGTTCNIRVLKNVASGTILSLNNVNKATFELEEDTDVLFEFYNEPVPTIIKDIQLIAGTEDNPYQAYKFINVKLQNKNMLIKTLNNATIAGDNNIVAYAGYKVYVAKVREGQNISISFNNASISSLDYIAGWFMEEPNFNISTAMPRFNTYRNLIVPEKIKYIAFRAKSTIVPNLEVQIEENSQPTEYVPHKEQNYPIRIGDLKLYGNEIIRDRIIRKDGKWYKEKYWGEILASSFDNSNISTTTTSISGKYRFVYSNAIGFRQTDANINQYGGYCNILKLGENGKTYENIQSFTVANNSKVYLYIDEISTGTIQEAISFLQEKNARFILPLKESLLEEIIDQNLIIDLNKLIKAKGMEGDTIITTDSNIYLDVEAFLDINKIVKELN